MKINKIAFVFLLSYVIKSQTDTNDEIKDFKDDLEGSINDQKRREYEEKKREYDEMM